MTRILYNLLNQRNNLVSKENLNEYQFCHVAKSPLGTD